MYENAHTKEKKEIMKEMQIFKKKKIEPEVKPDI